MAFKKHGLTNSGGWNILKKKDAAFCFPCYIFNKKPIGRVGPDRFTTHGFNKWKRVKCGKDCAFIIHEGKTPASAHNFPVRCYEDLKNQLCHIENVIEKQTTQEDVEDVIFGNAPKNAKYTSPDIQKEILRIIATNVQQAIRDEIGKAKFCLIVDESKKEQMDIVLRFVDQKGFVKERFLDLVHAKDTTSLTLKNEILSSLSHHKLDVQNLRGQGYDGASNMRGGMDWITSFVIKGMPLCLLCALFAHRLQLALVAASKDVSEVHTFFKNLNFIVNVISSPSKRNERGKGVNQIRGLQRARDTIWSSHFRSIFSLMKLFGPAIEVLNDIAIEGSTSSQRGDAKYALTHLLSFDFVISMHVIKGILGITNRLCHALQLKYPDIVNALDLMSTTKILIQKLRDEGWMSLLYEVLSFYENYSIPVHDIKAIYREIIWSHRKKDDVTVEHHYRVDVFIAAIDSQLQELNSRFNESVIEIIRLSVALDPRKSFNIDDICKLTKTFYPTDFTEQEKILLKHELQHYEIDVRNHPKLKDVCTLSQLCRVLQETGKSEMYPLVDRLVLLILTLPVSTATSERDFSAMKIVIKTL